MISRASAKAKGSQFETLVAGFLAANVDDRIERRARNGVKDRGDLSGVRTPMGDRVVVECKNHAQLNLAGWLAEATVEAGNDDADVKAVVFKRRGVTEASKQYVLMELIDFARLLGGEA